MEQVFTRIPFISERLSWRLASYLYRRKKEKERYVMIPVLEALTSIFAKPIAVALLPHLIKAEKTKQPGPQKKSIATRTIIVIIEQQPDTFKIQGLNPSVPWTLLVPVLIDAMIKVLNVFFGKNWLPVAEPSLLSDNTSTEPGPAPSPGS